MKLTKKQFAKIEHLMPVSRRKPEVSNYVFLCALLYIIDNGCIWRALPNEYGNWHTIYVRFNRWCKSGVIDRIFEALKEENIIEIHTKIICIDSTSIKVHPDATGARKISGEQSIGRSKKGGAHNNDTITFSTDKFSVYAIVYTDAQDITPPTDDDPTDDNPAEDKPDNNNQTNDQQNGGDDQEEKPDVNSPATGVNDTGLLLVMLAAAAIALTTMPRRKNES